MSGLLDHHQALLMLNTKRAVTQKMPSEDLMEKILKGADWRLNFLNHVETDQDHHEDEVEIEEAAVILAVAIDQDPDLEDEVAPGLRGVPDLDQEVVTAKKEEAVPDPAKTVDPEINQAQE